jgi:hypothetical protein
LPGRLSTTPARRWQEKALELYRRLVEKAFPDKAGLLKAVSA